MSKEEDRFIAAARIRNCTDSKYLDLRHVESCLLEAETGLKDSNNKAHRRFDEVKAALDEATQAKSEYIINALLGKSKWKK